MLMMAKSKPNKDIFSLGSALDDEDAADDGLMTIMMIDDAHVLLYWGGCCQDDVDQGATEDDDEERCSCWVFCLGSTKRTNAETRRLPLMMQMV